MSVIYKIFVQLRNNASSCNFLVSDICFISYASQ